MMGDDGAALPDSIDTALRRLRKAPRAQAPALLAAFRDNPGMSRRRSRATGRLPAHEAVLAASHGAPPEDRAAINAVLRLLLTQHPEAVRVADPIGGEWLPLHRALKSGGVDEDVFPALIGVGLDNAADLCNTPDPEQ